MGMVIWEHLQRLANLLPVSNHQQGRTIYPTVYTSIPVPFTGMIKIKHYVYTQYYVVVPCKKKFDVAACLLMPSIQTLQTEHYMVPAGDLFAKQGSVNS